MLLRAVERACRNMVDEGRDKVYKRLSEVPTGAEHRLSDSQLTTQILREYLFVIIPYRQFYGEEPHCLVANNRFL
jgi:hypothetical protein